MHLGRVNWRKISISLIVPQKGEQTAQACAMAWSIKGDVKKILLPRPEGGEISATSSLLSVVEDACLVSCPWIGLALFHLSSCIFS
jgi:hypothetical protein